jgi:hypothetical protein
MENNEKSRSWADKRTAAINAINGALANVEIARRRVNNAKSELGTAETELDKCEDVYQKSRARLDALLPETKTERSERIGAAVLTPKLTLGVDAQCPPPANIKITKTVVGDCDGQSPE